MLSAARRLRFNIVNPKIIHNKDEAKHDSKLSFYPMFGLKETKTGIIVLNKPDNNNNVTEQFADEFFRFLTSLEHDHTVENVWIQNKGPAFSGGADYGQLISNHNYLDKLMKLSIKVGQFNKPIFAKVNGSVRGISAYLLTMFSTPLGTPKSTLRLDQTSRGFIPIFGGTHRLSRMPCHVGLYLALTGDKLDADQMARVGALKGTFKDQHSNKQARRHLSNANLFFKNPYHPSSFTPSQVKTESLVIYKMNYFYDLLAQTHKLLFQSEKNFTTKYALNQYRIAQTEYYNTLHPFTSSTEQRRKLNNYFEMKHDRPFNYLKQKGVVEQSRTQNHVLSKLPIVKVLKIFGQDSMHKLMQYLKKDDSQWARQTEKKLRQKDPLSLHLTFRLIKNAVNHSWVQCLEQEYKVARRLLYISKINHLEISKGRSVTIFENPHSKSQIEDISQAAVEQFFRPYEGDHEILDHDAPNHSFLPTSDYWKEVPDAGRHYLNRTFFEDIHSKFAFIQAKRFLHLNKIDYRDRSFNIPALRQYMYKQRQYKKLVELEKQRLKSTLNSEISYKELKKQRLQYAEQMIKSPQLQKIVEEQIRQYFDLKFKTRFEQLEKTANIAGKQSRMEIFRNYVKTLTQNIVMKGRYIEDHIRQNNIKHGGIVRFDNQNSDAFHAQTTIEALNNDLNILKNAYKTRNLEDLQGIDPNKIKSQFLLAENQFSDWQFDLVKRDAALRLNYDKTILPVQIKQKYKRLINRAANTSQQIASLLSWTDQDIKNMIQNSPAPVITIRKFSQEVIENSPNIQQKIQKLNALHEESVKIYNEKISKVLQQKNQKSPIKHIFFDSKIIPSPFKTIHLNLLDQVLKFFEEKYVINGKLASTMQFINKQKQLSLVQKWAETGLKSSFSQFMKNDVEYVFSYLVVLHLKHMISELIESCDGLSQNKQNIIAKIANQKFGINIQGMSLKQFNRMFMTYLYTMLDMHEQSKHKIIFPQTKMIQFLNKLKILHDMKHKITLNFQSLMLLIAKDRKRIKDTIKGITPLLGYEPQLSLNALTIEHKQSNTAFPNIKQLSANVPITKNVKLKQTKMLEQRQRQGHQWYDHLNTLRSNMLIYQNKQKTQLVVGFNHYLRRFQGIMQRVAGSTMFLPKTLYQLEDKKIYEYMKSILRVQISKQEWFRSKIKSAIKNFFEFRFQKQKNMTEGQLRLFDEQFSQFFSRQMLGLIIKYETYAQETIAKQLIGQQQNLAGQNDSNRSLYQQLKSQIKNPRALKMLNNLVMAQNIVRDRLALYQLSENDQDPEDRGHSMQQKNHAENWNKKKINSRTLQRLGQQALRYPDEEFNLVNEKNVKHVKCAIQDVHQIKQSRFLDQLKQIHNVLAENDLKSQLQNRLRRIQALNL